MCKDCFLEDFLEKYDWEIMNRFDTRIGFFEFVNLFAEMPIYLEKSGVLTRKNVLRFPILFPIIVECVSKFFDVIFRKFNILFI